MDAIQLVKQDHRAVEQLFKQFEKAEEADRSAELKRIVQRAVKELSVHAAIEEQVLYPALRRAKKGAEDDVLEALEEHHLVKLTLLELDKMSPQDDRFCAKMTVLMENVRHHVKEEEKELLPLLRAAFEPKDLKELGALMEQAKKVAPTRPHPASPDTPPGNFVAGALASILDRGRDALRAAADRGRKAARGGARSMNNRARKAVARGRSAVAHGREAVSQVIESQPSP